MIVIPSTLTGRELNKILSQFKRVKKYQLISINDEFDVSLRLLKGLARVFGNMRLTLAICHETELRHEGLLITYGNGEIQGSCFLVDPKRAPNKIDVNFVYEKDKDNWVDPKRVLNKIDVNFVYEKDKDNWVDSISTLKVLQST